VNLRPVTRYAITSLLASTFLATAAVQAEDMQEKPAALEKRVDSKKKKAPLKTHSGKDQDVGPPAARDKTAPTAENIIVRSQR